MNGGFKRKSHSKPIKEFNNPKRYMVIDSEYEQQMPLTSPIHSAELFKHRQIIDKNCMTLQKFTRKDVFVTSKIQSNSVDLQVLKARKRLEFLTLQCQSLQKMINDLIIQQASISVDLKIKERHASLTRQAPKRIQSSPSRQFNNNTKTIFSSYSTGKPRREYQDQNDNETKPLQLKKQKKNLDGFTVSFMDYNGQKEQSKKLTEKRKQVRTKAKTKKCKQNVENGKKKTKC